MGKRRGLVDRQDSYLEGTNDVVLVFPSKECTLPEVQTGEEKRGEIDYIKLTPEEGVKLLAPKVFSKARRYSQKGIEEITSIDDRDNLILRGDNFVVLGSLAKRYAGKVKCIYIDPPYNTGASNSSYPDSFPRSTWLAFMKNRIELAKKLMARDGVFLVQCSFHHYPYLKVLLDGIMGEKNYKLTFHILVRHPERIINGDKEFNDVIEYILVYSASPEYKMPKRAMEKKLDDYVYTVELLTEGKTITLEDKKVGVFLPGEYLIHKGKAKPDQLKRISIRGGLREKNSSGRFYVKYLEQLNGEYPPLTLFKVDGIGDDLYGFRYFQLPKDGRKNGVYFQGMPVSSRTTNLPYANFYDFVEGYNFVNAEGGVEFRYGKKPEALIGFLLRIFTQEKDLVLDFFLGSGTTAATAHKMDRQYIGVEQLDYGDNDSVIRLQKVINGDPTGISAAVNWQGGGSFVYCELKKRQAKEGSSPKRLIRENLDYGDLYVDFSDLKKEVHPTTKKERQFTQSFYRQG